MQLRVEKDRVEVEREREDDEVIRMDLSGMDEYKIAYFHGRITKISEREAIGKAARADIVVVERDPRAAAAMAEQLAM